MKSKVAKVICFCIFFLRNDTDILIKSLEIFFFFDTRSLLRVDCNRYAEISEKENLSTFFVKNKSDVKHRNPQDKF